MLDITFKRIYDSVYSEHTEDACEKLCTVSALQLNTSNVGSNDFHAVTHSEVSLILKLSLDCTVLNILQT